MKAGTRLFLIALGFATGVNSALAQMHVPDHYDHQFEKADDWAKTFDDPTRDHWQQPEKVIAALAVEPNAAVVDIGSGTGYFAVRLARSLPQGRVLGIDIQPDMVRYLNQRADREGLPNLASQLGAKDDPKLPWPVDLAVVLDTYHHIGGRDQYFQRVRDRLKPGGRLVVIDFRQDAVLGPPKHFRISPDQVKQELSKVGFEFVKEETFLPQQYLLVFQAARQLFVQTAAIGGFPARPPNGIARCAQPAKRVSLLRCVTESGTNLDRGLSDSKSTNIDVTREGDGT